MARQTSVIQQSIIAFLVAALLAIGIVMDPSHWSAYDYRQLLTYVTAQSQAIHEQLWDAFKVDIENIVAKASPQTASWFQNQMFLFQYDATTPQIIQFDVTGVAPDFKPTFAPYYLTPNAALRIITNCSVVKGYFGTTTIKTATGGTTPAALSGPQLSAAQAYVNTLAVPGINYNVVSSEADKLYAAMTVSYLGQYSAVIPVADGTVVQAIKAYLLGIPFNGVVVIDDLLGAVRAVPGVTGVVLNNVSARADGGTIGDNPLVVAKTWITDALGNCVFQTIAGYIVGETIGGSTLNDTITYNAV